ncbi:predicted protein [Uncinocarpus reesii 1704]|uniref:Pentatricopeptide repeat protein n=1 Tax=Uncinocarpus reesii (strain UAMH 1704) TaxID=336963 RepID=C4JTI0_UNCRE|nr:uncharacterized protein UREG_05769 [Uncinocarpus reesii 1704]EEP80927.1 predicted protein [Uncinocarpus reesii 1704]
MTGVCVRPALLCSPRSRCPSRFKSSHKAPISPRHFSVSQCLSSSLKESDSPGLDITQDSYQTENSIRPPQPPSAPFFPIRRITSRTPTQSTQPSVSRRLTDRFKRHTSREPHRLWRNASAPAPAQPSNTGQKGENGNKSFKISNGIARAHAQQNPKQHPAFPGAHILKDRRLIEEAILEEARHYSGFSLNSRTYEIEFQARWNSLYAHSVVRPDYNRNFQTLFKAKAHGTPSTEIWNQLRVQEWTIVASWAKHFTNVTDGKRFWSGLKLSQKRERWPDIAFWLLLNSPQDALTFLESTADSPYPPFRMVSECMLYLDAFYYEHLTCTPESKSYYHGLLRSTIGPARWPVINVSQRGIRTYLKRCELSELLEAVEKMLQGETYVTAPTLMFVMDLLHKFNDASNSFRVLQLLPHRMNQWISFDSDVVAKRCCKLLTLDSTYDEKGTRNFQILPKILNLGIRPNRVMLNIIIQNAIKLGDPEMAWDIYDYSGFSPDSYTYLLLLDDAVERGDTVRIQYCLRTIAANSELAQEPHVISKVLHALYRQVTPETESKLFNEMIQVYCLGHDPQPLRELGIVREELNVKGWKWKFPPSPHSLVLMVSAYLRLHKSMEQTIEVYQQFYRLVREGHDSVGKLAETDHIYNTFLMALQPDKTGIRPSLMIIQDMYRPLPETAFLKAENRPIRQRLPTMVSWGILLNTAMSHGDLETFAMIRQAMIEHGVKMNTSTWNAVLRGYAKLKMVDEFAEAMNQMLLEGLTPDEYTFAAVNRMRDQARLQETLDRIGVDLQTLTLINQPRLEAIQGMEGSPDQHRQILPQELQISGEETCDLLEVNERCL